MTLHILIDQAFTWDFINDVNALGINDQHFLVYGKGMAGKTFISPAENIFLYKYGSRKYNQVISELGKKYQKLYVHWLSYEACEVISNAPSNIEISSVFWGNDFAAPVSFYYERVYEPETINYYKTHASKQKIKWFNNPRWAYAMNPMWVYKTLRQKLKGSKGQAELFEQKKKAIQRLTYFVHYNPYDLEWVKVQTPTDAEFKKFFYAAGYEDAENILKEKKSTDGTTRILVGHSSSLTGNHLDTVKMIHDLSFSFPYEIICPLSYGDTNYRDRIIEQGKKLLSTHFNPVIDFLPREKYYQLLSNADAAIFNVRRTEGMANINMLIKLGKKIFLNKDCPAYYFLKDLGIKVFTLDELKSNPEIISVPLTAEEKLKNSKQLDTFFSKEKRLEYIRKLFAE